MASKAISSSFRALLRTTLSSAKTTPFHHPRQVRNQRFLSSSELPNDDKNIKPNTKVNFSPPDSDSDENDSDKKPENPSPKPAYKPYDPFSKKPVVSDPEDPKDLQEIFHKMRSEGLFDSAVKMFDGLSKDGLTHEALELFGRIKDEGTMPEVVAHTAVIEAYAGADRPKDARKTFLRMLAAGVAPNAYTYAVLIKGLSAHDAFVAEAAKYAVEMTEKGMRPNAGVYVAAVEGLVRVGMEVEARELVGRVRARGFGPIEGDVREVLKGKRGPLVRGVMGILIDK